MSRYEVILYWGDENQAAESADWARFAARHLGMAYGENEPDYSPTLIKQTERLPD